MATTMIAPAALVLGAARIPLPFGLFSVVPFRPEGEGRWQTGVQFETEPCEPLNGIGPLYCDADNSEDPEGTPTVGLPKELENGMGNLGGSLPFTVYGDYVCSPIGNSLGHAQDMADARLLAREEAAIEEALWGGALGNTPNFTSTTGLGTVAFADAWDAIGQLEQHIAEEYGSQGVLHMSRRIASGLTFGGQIKAKGGRLVTELGTPVVAGTGYGSAKIVVSAPLFGYRSEIFTSSNRPGDLLDRAQNDLYAVAERNYVLGFDPCGLASVNITPPAE
jgi:hypothetical protein